MVEHQPSKLDTWVRFPSPAFCIPFFTFLGVYAGLRVVSLLAALGTPVMLYGVNLLALQGRGYYQTETSYFTRDTAGSLFGTNKDWILYCFYGAVLAGLLAGAGIPVLFLILLLQKSEDTGTWQERYTKEALESLHMEERVLVYENEHYLVYE